MKERNFTSDLSDTPGSSSCSIEQTASQTPVGEQNNVVNDCGLCASNDGCPSEPVSDWQINLGNSIADYLEKLTVDKNLTTRQVKKLLRAVLTNEDVVAAFRHYMNLNEPETGQMSANTKRCMKDLSGFLPAELRKGLSLAEPSTTVASQSIEPRVVTRSVARVIQSSLRDYLRSDQADQSNKQSTILDMEFSDDDSDDDDDDDDNDNAVATDADTSEMDRPVSSLRSHSDSIHDRDEDYHPGPVDFAIFHRDQLFDVPVGENLSEKSATTVLDESVSSLSLADENSQQSTGTAVDSNSLLDDDDNETLHGRKERFVLPRRRKRLHSHCARTAKTSSRRDSHLPLVSVKPEAPLSSHPTPYRRVNDDAVYAEFLRTLFSSDESVPNSPRKKKRKSCLDRRQSEKRVRLARQPPLELPSTSERLVDDDEDPDDPEFDVMAELDHVDREDFFDELRVDRAVRVSKLEAKTLHQDLYNLFSEDEDDQGDTTLGRTSGPRASEVYAMTSHCHRLMMQSANRMAKTEPIEDVTVPDPSLVAENTVVVNTETSTDRTKTTQRRLTSDQRIQLQRQLGMHVQLLTTHFVCTYDRSDWHASVTRPCAGALKALVSCRDAFDLMAQQRQQPNRSTADPTTNLRSFYWSCSILDDAARLVTAYAGLSYLPNLPPNCYRNPYNPYRRLGWSHYPLPLCLIRLMLDNPIWSYPYLMPSFLPTPPNSSIPVPQKRRLVFRNCEDALILLGMDDFATKRVCRRPIPPSVTKKSGGSVTGGVGVRHLGYSLIHQHLLPHRHLQQVRIRRWNLPIALSCSSKQIEESRDNELDGRVKDEGEETMGEDEAGVGNRLKPQHTPVDKEKAQFATRCLHQFFSGMTENDTFNTELLQNMAAIVAPSSVPHKIPLHVGRILDLDTAAPLFDQVEGLPRDAGYERVLLSANPSRPLRGSRSKLINDMLTDFVEDSECLWWPDSNKPNHLVGSALDGNILAHSAQVATCEVIRSDDKPPFVSAAGAPGSSVSNYNLLGPTFLPALPVDIISDGNVVLSQTAEPTLLEFRSPTTAPICSELDPTKRVRSDGSKPRHDIGKNIEALLREIRTQYMRKHKVVHEPKCLTLSTIAQLSCTPAISGKVPLPRLASYNQKQRIWRKYRSISFMRSRRSGRRAVRRSSNSFTTHESDEMSSSTNRPLPSHLSNEVQYPLSQHFEEPDLASCQKSVQLLCEQFHQGLDMLVCADTQQHSRVVTRGSFPNYSKNAILPDSHPEPADSLPSNSNIPASSVTSNPLSAGRFLNRCRGRGEATSADLFILPSSLVDRRQSSTDDCDVHQARSFLDKCRSFFDTHVYATLVFSLRTLEQVTNTTTSLSDSTPLDPKAQISRQLTRILNVLKINRNLWEDFVCMLTPDQARCLGLLSTYLFLTRIGRVQRVLKDLVPPGKRFWIRLYNLALFAASNVPGGGGRRMDKNPPSSLTSNAKSSSPRGSTNVSSMKNFSSVGGRNCKRKRFVPFPISKTWEVLEGSWRNRPVLMSQLAALVDATHKPYSGFEQNFEEIDLLAHKPLSSPNSLPINNSLSLNEMMKQYLQSDDGWETCTSLSAASRSCQPTNRPRHKHCPCPCHPDNDGNHPNPSATKISTRHCLSCSLRVHCGIVYVDEFNRHLRPVNITWPDNFIPTNVVKRSPSRKRSKKRPISESNQTNNPGRPPVQCSTRSFLAQLAESHQSCDDGSVVNLPNAANRRVSVEFLPLIMPENIKREDLPEADEATKLPVVYDESPDRLPSPPPSPEKSINTDSSPLRHDDDAACFNTEAFLQPSDVVPNENWHSEEDRQLLIFCKARGRYCSSMFGDLARIWVPIPDPTVSGRTAEELEARFKYLMRLVLGTDYDQELFRSPRRDDEAN